jgi:hypothetical protein
MWSKRCPESEMESFAGGRRCSRVGAEQARVVADSIGRGYACDGDGHVQRGGMESGKRERPEGPCRLCNRTAPLCKSHILPKFAIEQLKKIIGNEIRWGPRPNQPQQDGLKPYFLCEQCENRFSKVETYFVDHFFVPVVENRVLQSEYDRRLFAFGLSLVWRAVALPGKQVPERHRHFLPLVDAADREWRDFFEHGVSPPTHNTVHMLVTDPFRTSGFPITEAHDLNNFARYFDYGLDGSVVTSDVGCLVFVKLPRFLFIAPLTPRDPADWQNTLVAMDGGILREPQQLRDHWVTSVILETAQRHEMTLSQSLSPKQVAKVWKQFLAQEGTRKHAAFWADVRAASRRVRSLLSPQRRVKVGPNELCPCGSKKKFKRCCGKT